jgi:hypothetical protein
MDTCMGIICHRQIITKHEKNFLGIYCLGSQYVLP